MRHDGFVARQGCLAASPFCCCWQNQSAVACGVVPDTALTSLLEVTDHGDQARSTCRSGQVVLQVARALQHAHHQWYHDKAAAQDPGKIG